MDPYFLLTQIQNHHVNIVLFDTYFHLEVVLDVQHIRQMSNILKKSSSSIPKFD